MVFPIAVFNGRRPLRAGYKVFLDDRHVGYVTSGTAVPFSRFAGEGLTARPSEDSELRPIGLALLDSDLRYRTDRPVVLQVQDDRGNRSEAELVERNLWPAVPFTRAYTGFAAPVLPSRIDANEAVKLADGLRRDSATNTAWRRRECINLIPSEQAVSPFVEDLCAADPAGRYNEHNRLKALGPDAPEIRYYKGTQFIMMIEGPLRDTLAFGWPQSVPVDSELMLPKLIARTRLHIGLAIAVIVAVIVWQIQARTVFGTESRAVGLNAGAAAFAGISLSRTLLGVALLSGALAGLAGAIEVTGLKGYVTTDLSPGYGYAGIVVAMLAGLHPIGVIAAALFVAVVFVGADAMHGCRIRPRRVN